MTTREAEQRYLADHQREMNGKPFAVYNPHNKPVEDLPAIYGFNNGTNYFGAMAVSISEDGVCLGSHTCSSEGYMPHDLGMLEGTRRDRHADDYQKHYPDGYRMEFVPSDQIDAHAGLTAAFRLNKQREDSA